MNVHYCDDIQLQVGKFKQPFSYEQLIQDRFVPTMERSLIDQLVPARDFGAMVHGQKLFADHLDYGLALSNGETNGNTVDTNNHKDFNGRVALRPLNSPDLYPWLRGLQVGLSGGVGVENEAFARRSFARRTPCRGSTSIPECAPTDCGRVSVPNSSISTARSDLSRSTSK
jgi:phosphate-selective porin OprO/OprP